MLPPVFDWIFIKSKFTSFLAKSATSNTASTAIRANSFFLIETTFDPSAVQAAYTKLSWLSASISIYSDIVSKYSNLFMPISYLWRYHKLYQIHHWFSMDVIPYPTIQVLIPKEIQPTPLLLLYHLLFHCPMIKIAPQAI